MEPLRYDAVTMDARNAAFGELESQRQAIDSVNQPKILYQSGSMKDGQNTSQDLVNAEIEREVTDHIQHSITTAVEKMLSKAIQLATDCLPLKKKRTASRFIYFSTSSMIRTKLSDSSSETQLSNLADWTKLIDTIIRKSMNQKISRTTVDSS